MLSQVTREINVEALPIEVPEHIEVDVTRAWRSATRCASSIDAVPEGVTFLDDPEETVLATVTVADRCVEPEPGGRARSSRRARRLPRARRRREGRGRGALPRATARGLRRRNLRGVARAPLPSGRAGLDARPAGRGPRQSRSRVRAHPPQRRLAGGRRARAAARRLVALEVLGASSRRCGSVTCGSALLKPETYMNESALGGRPPRFFKVEPDGLLVVHDDVDLEPGRLQARPVAASPGTTACARSRSSSGRRSSSACGSASGGPGRGDRALGRRTTSSRSSSRETTWTRSSPRRRTRSRRSPPKARGSAAPLQLDRVPARSRRRSDALFGG